MNRAQRRKFQKDPKSRQSQGKTMSAAEEQADFSGVPLATMCQSIQLLIAELCERGFPVYDFDNKSKFIHGIQILHGKVFFLAAEEDSDHEKV